MYIDHKPESMKAADFRNPPSKFRGAPFWAWNCKLKKEDLRKQIGYFQEMGMGGFHMHCRTGLDTEYLSDEFMDMVEECRKTAKKKNMLCWLYDEDRYASGYGGGFVTKKMAYREKSLIFTPFKETGYLENGEAFERACDRGEEPKGYFLNCYRVTLEQGMLVQYEVLHEEVQQEETIWYAYLAVSEKSSWWNNQTYVDTLNKEAIDRFIECTYERYYEKNKEEFGTTIPAIFTDEPQFAKLEHFNFAEEKRKIAIPYTSDFEDSFLETYGSSFLMQLPELFWEQNNKPATVRYRYVDHLTDRFVEAYAKNIGSWCESHNLALTGHMKGEETLCSQTIFVGEVMRSLRYFHIPGHDVLCDQRDYPTAKMAQSAARQYNRYGALAETGGVTNWDFDFKGHKLSGDWQAAMGIAVRVHHVSWLSMRGEAKRDYPASINYQSPWYREYSLIETYFGRINAAMTSGTPEVRIGVIHPVESFWMAFGPYDQTFEKREALEEQYRSLCDWLLFGQLDFDYISEKLLEEEEGEVNAKTGFAVGVMRYEAVVVPPCITLREHTVRRLTAFAKSGGKVVLLGDAPSCVNGSDSKLGDELAAEADRIPCEKAALLKKLEAQRSAEFLLDHGGRADNLVYQMRRDEEGKWLFIAHGFEKCRDDFWSMVECRDYPYRETVHLKLKGCYELIWYDAMTGEEKPLPCVCTGRETQADVLLGIHDSLLLRLKPAKPNTRFCEAFADPCAAPVSRRRLSQPFKVEREEPNVLLLDRAEYRLEEEAWQPEEDVLKLDNICRRKLSYPLREEAGAQPWTVPGELAFPHTLFLRFYVDADLPVKAKLALEDPQLADIYVNGALVREKADGYFVDEAIETVPVPELKAGRNVIELHIPYGEKGNVESVYLLGAFGVEVAGRKKKLVQCRDHIVFGDVTRQGLPFYGSNLVYYCKIQGEGKRVVLRAQYFSCPLLTVRLDGKPFGAIAFAPYERDLGILAPGEHEIAITAFGNRYPTFGQLHNCDKTYSWFASCSWRTVNDRYAEEYQLKETGILVSPELLTFEPEREPI